MLTTILIILLVIWLLSVLLPVNYNSITGARTPTWGYNTPFGGGVGAVILILVILAIIGVI